MKFQIIQKDGYLQNLPYNCIFNKVKTGCGATTVAITNNENYIIAVPTTEIITNKCYPIRYKKKLCKWDEKEKKAGKSPLINLFGVHGTSIKIKKALNEYLSEKGVKKIMCTYDKVEFVLKYINPQKYRFLCDEYHYLLQAYSFRSNAVNKVLDNFHLFKSFCFMSATPISCDFKPNQLKNEPEHVADWGEIPTLKIFLEKTPTPFVYVAKIIEKYQQKGFFELNGHKSKEAFFFVNSVTGIKAILDSCEIKKEECRIICAKTKKNRENLDQYEISDSSSETKKFNFITSKSFEGVDFHSETGLVFVISNCHHKHTLLDISTSIPQIAGRIRTKSNPFKNMIVHCFSTKSQNMNENVSYDELLKDMQNEKVTAQKRVDYLNQADADIKRQQIKELSDKGNYSYIRYNRTSKLFIVNDMLLNYELYCYNIKCLIYNSGASLKEHHQKQGHTTTNVRWKIISERLNPDVKPNNLEFVALLRTKYELNSFVSNAEAKELVKPYGGTKGTSLKRWLDLKETKRKINGKRIGGYLIIGFRESFDD